MVLCDVNVLVYAHRKDEVRHDAYRDWLTALVGGPQPYALSEFVLGAFLRVVTNPRIFARPTPFEQAEAFCSILRTRGNAVLVTPGPRHWQIFVDVCRRANAKGNLVADAYLAAIAIESGCSFATADRDFTRFPDLTLADVPA